jgi:hypothetical protein
MFDSTKLSREVARMMRTTILKEISFCASQ